MKHPMHPSVLAAALVMCCGPLWAEDIDLFVNAPGSAGLPNVLFIVDNTANWNTAFENEMSALKSIFEDLPTDGENARLNVGVMFAAETGSPNNSVQGGYVRATMRPMTAKNKKLYADMFAALDKLKDRSNGGQSSLMMAEAYRYFSGGNVYSGNGKVKTDYDGNTGSEWSSSILDPESLAAMQAIYDLPDNALSGKYDTTYTSPVGTGCGKNFIIYISNGKSQDSNSVLAAATSMLAEAGGDTTTIVVSPSNSQSNVSDEWARFMNSDKSAVKIAVYTIDVDPGSQPADKAWTALLKSMAKAGGNENRYKAVSSSADAGQEIKDAVNDALADIQAVNSVFAAVSLPVSVNTQGTYRNQVFVGMFRPDEDALPRWYGNLKQYKLGLSSSQLRLQDADSATAINPETGFMAVCARSFWSAENEYWAFSERGSCSDETNLSDSPDGDIVEKGAQGQVLRATDPTKRTLKTCSATFNSCQTTLTDFAASNNAITPGLLGVSTDTEADALINWARGSDMYDENNNTDASQEPTLTEMRASAHADIVHSRPVAIDFGSSSASQVVVFYGGNDGILRAINGNQTAAMSSGSVTVSPGGELWAFMPPEFYGNINRLRDNKIRVDFPNVADDDAAPKPYGIDGPITAHKDGSTAWVYAAMRRGGRALYAFNASDPFDIKLKWKVGCGDNFPTSGTVSDDNCATGFENIGQTWSSAKVFKAKAYSSGSAPLLIMGGGYDPCEDTTPAACSSTKGDSIYVLDADTGAKVKEFSTDRSVIADVIVVPDANGLAKYAYAVDLGGNIYRLTLSGNTTDAWSKLKIASLGCATPASCAENRKFMFTPDVLADGEGYILLLGSGDREKPLLTDNTVNNYFFMVKDQPGDSTWLTSETANCGSGNELLCLNSLLAITTDTPSKTELATKKGWYLALASTEQVVTSAITIFGVVTFSTHEPANPETDPDEVTQCKSNLGTARVYNILYSNAAPAEGNNRYEELPGDIGLPPSPVAGMVELDNGQTVPFCIGCSPESPLEGEQPEVPAALVPAQSKRRVYWYIQH